VAGSAQRDHPGDVAVLELELHLAFGAGCARRANGRQRGTEGEGGGRETTEEGLGNLFHKPFMTSNNGKPYLIRCKVRVPLAGRNG
jgi:hypothetical protein